MIIYKCNLGCQRNGQWRKKILEFTKSLFSYFKKIFEKKGTFSCFIINDIEYKLVSKFDKRKYCEYYYSLLKSKHLLIFTFCNKTDYNLLYFSMMI